jgi:hypothetical protein
MEPQNTSMNTPAPEVQVPQQKTSTGPLVGSLIVLFVLVIGGFYLWNSERKQGGMSDAPPPFILGDETADAGLPPTSNSDEVADIESDVAATDLNTFEAEIEADMQAAESTL